MKQLLIIVAVLMLCIGCQSTPGAGDSPATDGGNSTAAGGFGAQTVGGDQGQAQTPQTNTSGTASNFLKFASEGVDPAVALELMKLAAEKDWTAEELSVILKGMNGAPELVTITVHDGIHAITGANENVGSSGGTGGTGTSVVKEPKKP